MNRTRLAAIGGLIVLTLTGCATTPTEPVERITTNEQQAAYLNDVRTVIPEAMFADTEALVSLGVSSCILFDQGVDGPGVIEVMVNSGVNELEAVALAGSAVQNLCPEHAA